MRYEWKTFTVQELIDLGMLEEPLDGNHGAIHPKTSDYVPTGVPFIMANNLVNGRVDFNNCAFISEQQALTLRKGFSHPGDVLLTHKATIGRTAIVTEEYDTIILTPQVTYYRVKKGISNRYLKYYFDSRPFQELFANWAGSGSTRAYLGITAQRKLPIVVPPFNIQCRIADICGVLDDKIELNQRINENLERQAQAIFKSWFVDFEPFGGEIPANWEWLKFSSFLTTSNEKSNDPSLPMFSVTDQGIFPRDEKFKKKLSMTNSKNKVVHQTDLVFGMSREILNWGIMRHPIGGVSAAYNVYQVSDQINTFYLESYMKANYRYFRDLIKPASREGQGLDKNALMQKVILIPSQDVLEKYYHIESALVRMSKHVLEDSERLAAIRDTLLPKLMAGEIDVSTIQH